MQKIIFEDPYEFISPCRGKFWFDAIERLRLYDYWLRKHNGVEDYEVRHIERLRRSHAAGHGIMLAPNHPRPADPITMGFLGRHVGFRVYAMAGWHLFKKSRFQTWALRRMGAFSIYREGVDRKAIDTAVEILVEAERPLVLFPEGVTTRTNDRLTALLDGVAFIARAAAKRRAKSDGGKVVVHPIAVKYFFSGDLRAALDPVLTRIEKQLTWRQMENATLPERIQRIALGLLALKEIEYFGEPQPGEKGMETIGDIVDYLQELVGDK